MILAIVLIGGVTYIGANFGNKRELTTTNLSNSENLINTAGSYSFETNLKTLGFSKELTENGVFDSGKYQLLAGSLSVEERKIFESSGNEKIIITPQNNQLYLNLLWGLGLAQENIYLEELKNLENQGRLGQLASTGGWNIAQGDATLHFIRHNILNLSLEQQRRVANIAATIYRPCCGNSARFADCNHGMAMLGVVSLAVSQGLSDEEIYRTALGFNSLWFPSQYDQMAQYFKIFEKKETNQVNPKTALSAKFSSGQGFSQNVAKPLVLLNNPSGASGSGGDSCSL